MDESEKRKRRVCFTGHRPEKLTIPNDIIKKRLLEEIITSINEGYRVFISGMARGTDIWAAEIILKIKTTNNDIKLICAIPYKGFESNWSTSWQLRYKDILSGADLIRYICPNYSKNCFQIRNQWMVDHSAKVIAVYNGTKGGTLNTIQYANKHKIPIILIT